MNITIVHTRKYDFKDEQSGKPISGIKVEFMFNDDLKPVIVDSNERGYQIANGTLTLDKENNIKDVPGVYEALFVTRVNAKQQPVQKLVDVYFLSSVPELYTTAAVKEAI